MGGLTAVLGIFGLFWLFWVVIISILVGLFVFWIMMIVDVAQRKFSEQNQQLVWILVVVLASYIGAIIYYFVVKRKETQITSTKKIKKIK